MLILALLRLAITFCVTLGKGFAFSEPQSLLAEEEMLLEGNTDWMVTEGGGEEATVCREGSTFIISLSPIRHPWAWRTGQGHPLPEVLPGP